MFSVKIAIFNLVFQAPAYVRIYTAADASAVCNPCCGPICHFGATRFTSQAYRCRWDLALNLNPHSRARVKFRVSVRFVGSGLGARHQANSTLSHSLTLSALISSAISRSQTADFNSFSAVRASFLVWKYPPDCGGC